MPTISPQINPWMPKQVARSKMGESEGGSSGVGSIDCRIRRRYGPRGSSAGVRRKGFWNDGLMAISFPAFGFFRTSGNTSLISLLAHHVLPHWVLEPGTAGHAVGIHLDALPDTFGGGFGGVNVLDTVRTAGAASGQKKHQKHDK